MFKAAFFTTVKVAEWSCVQTNILKCSFCGFVMRARVRISRGNTFFLINWKTFIVKYRTSVVIFLLINLS